MQDTIVKTGDVQQIMKKDFVKSRKKKKYTHTAVEKAASKSKQI